MYGLAKKGLYSLSYGFSSSHVWMWDLEYKESWVLQNWCFWTEVLEKTLENPLDCKEIQQVHLYGNQSWIFIRTADVKAETPILWPSDAKNKPIGKDPDAGKDWMWEEKGMTEAEMVGWLNELEFEYAPGVGDGQRGLACCSPWSHKELDMTKRLNWTEDQESFLKQISAIQIAPIHFDIWQNQYNIVKLKNKIKFKKINHFVNQKKTKNKLHPL